MDHRLFIEIAFGLSISFLVTTATVRAAQLESLLLARSASGCSTAVVAEQTRAEISDREGLPE